MMYMQKNTSFMLPANLMRFYLKEDCESSNKSVPYADNCHALSRYQF